MAAEEAKELVVFGGDAHARHLAEEAKVLPQRGHVGAIFGQSGDEHGKVGRARAAALLHRAEDLVVDVPAQVDVHAEHHREEQLRHQVREAIRGRVHQQGGVDAVVDRPDDARDKAEDTTAAVGAVGVVERPREFEVRPGRVGDELRQRDHRRDHKHPHGHLHKMHVNRSARAHVLGELGLGAAEWQ